MTDRMTLKAQVRDSKGTRHSQALRNSGKLPAVVYGHKQDPVSIAIDMHDFIEALHHGHRLFDIDVDGKNEPMLVKELQYDHFGRAVIHADLIRVDLKEKVTVQVQLELKGTPAGAAEGGILDQHLDAVEIECLVTEIPDVIEVSVKELNVGDSLHVSDVKLNPGFKMVTDAEALIANCHVVSEVETTEELEEEMPAEPELVGEKDEQGEEGSEESKE